MPRLKFDFIPHDDALQASNHKYLIEIYKETLFEVEVINKYNHKFFSLGQFEYLEDAIEEANRWSNE